jgi:hypothetical protein
MVLNPSGLNLPHTPGDAERIPCFLGSTDIPLCKCLIEHFGI